jgi:hypothetical protein
MQLRHLLGDDDRECAEAELGILPGYLHGFARDHGDGSLREALGAGWQLASRGLSAAVR